jgi:small subunit ribosomal protein S20
LANHKSELKRARQNEIRRLRNRSSKTRVKNVVRDVRQAVSAKATDGLQGKLETAQAIIAKGSKKGAIHRNTAARKISRLARLVNTLKS